MQGRIKHALSTKWVAGRTQNSNLAEGATALDVAARWQPSSARKPLKITKRVALLAARPDFDVGDLVTQIVC